MSDFGYSGENYFLLLDIPEAADLDAGRLREQYFSAQRAFHPDKARNAEERLHFLQRSADINRAYQTLKEEDGRLFYLLALSGVDVSADSAAFPVPPVLLMEVMEWREQAESADSEAERQSLTETFIDKQRELRTTCKAALAAGDLHAATEAALRLRYLSKLLPQKNSVMS